MALLEDQGRREGFYLFIATLPHSGGTGVHTALGVGSPMYWALHSAMFFNGSSMNIIFIPALNGWVHKNSSKILKS